MMFLILFLLILIFILIFLSSYYLKKKIIGTLKIIKTFIEIGDYFFTFKLFQKFSHPTNRIKKNRVSHRNLAIIIQGPIIKKSNFTLETVNFYSKIYPGSQIILSSWKDDQDFIKKKIKPNKDIHILLNDLPKYKGEFNINLQSISTVNAIKHAKKLKCKYVLKSRSDTRINFKNAPDYLINLLKFYKINKNLKTKQSRRIISTNFTLRYRLYGISDLILFGTINDIFNYFNIITTPQKEKDFVHNEKRKFFKDKNYYVEGRFCPERYFFCNYFTEQNIKLNWTVKDYITKISQNFIIVNNEKLEIYWKKSNRADNHFANIPAPEKDSLEFNFEEWLKLFFKYKKIKSL